jgi:predicted RNA-binding protein
MTVQVPGFFSVGLWWQKFLEQIYYFDSFVILEFPYRAGTLKYLIKNSFIIYNFIDGL